VSWLARNWPAYLRSLVHVRWERGLPRLVVHERYEAPIKWTLRVLWFVGVCTSVLTLGPLAGLGLALLLSALERFLERTVFRYATIVVTPLPDFSFSMDEITGMVFAYPADDDKRPAAHPCVGFAFSRRDLAAKFFDVLRRWNYGERIDKDNNIRLTFIWPTDGRGYYTCLYPHLRRRGVEAAFEEVGARMEKEKPGKEQLGLSVVWMIRKHLNESPGPGIRTFTQRHPPQDDRPFWLQAFLSVDGAPGEILRDVEPILKFHYRVVNEGDLMESNLEYPMMQWPK
jgi:hypothetical protein